VFRSSTYVFTSPESAARAFEIALGQTQPNPGENIDLIYARLSHPNAEILEDQVVPLEPEATSAAVFNSGMAAISTLFFTFCPQKSSFIYTTPLYGGTYHLIHQILEPLGFQGIPVRAGDSQAMKQAIASAVNLKLIFIETPANPILTMTDISAASEQAQKHPDAPLVAVDNTFLGPTFQHPLKLGADLVVYSATKYLSGFSDLLGGIVLGRDSLLISHLRGIRAILGNILQADECWMLDGRLPTVALRMNKQSKSAQRLVEALASHEKISTIHYPTQFKDPKQIRIRNAQCRFPGAIFSIEMKGGKRAAFDFLRHLRIGRSAVSLGGVETLVCHPATTTHSEIGAEDRLDFGITDALVRISVGIEDWRDLLQDFQQALDAVS
jgi:cystathionine beta-lyase/cystathionine gamma-synthase